MCFECAISTCLREKYFANINITISFIKSDGWSENPPSDNQLFAPCATCPTINNISSNDEKKRKSHMSTSVRFRNLTSNVAKTKNIIKEIETQIICLVKKLLSGENVLIVTSPAMIMGRVKPSREKSIRFCMFSRNFMVNY